jgi:hypothetical protein
MTPAQTAAPAPIDRHDHAGHEGRGVRGQEDGRTHDFLDAAAPAHRGLLDRLLGDGGILVIGLGPRHGVLHIAGIEGIDPDAVLGPFGGQRLHHQIDPALGDAVGDDPRKGHQAGIGGGHDDGAARLLPAHLARRRLGREEIADDVNRQHLLQRGRIDLIGRLRPIDAGIAMHDVQAAEFTDRAL